MFNVLEFKEVIEKISEVKLLDGNEGPMIGFAAISDVADNNFGMMCQDAVCSSDNKEIKVYMVAALFTEDNDVRTTKALLNKLMTHVDPNGIYILFVEPAVEAADFAASIGFLNMGWIVGEGADEYFPMMYASESASVVLSYLQDKYEKEFSELLAVVMHNYSKITSEAECFDDYFQKAVRPAQPHFTQEQQDEVQKLLSDKCRFGGITTQVLEDKDNSKNINDSTQDI